MSQTIVGLGTSVVPIQTRTLGPGATYVVLLSSTTDVGTIVTVRDMDGALSSPQQILISTTPDVILVGGATATTVTLQQGHAFCTLKSVESTTWQVINESPFPDPAQSYSVRGVAYSSMTITSDVIMYDFFSTAGAMNTNNLLVKSTMNASGPLFVSSAYVSTPYVAGPSYAQVGPFFGGGSLRSDGAVTCSSVVGTDLYAGGTATFGLDLSIGGNVTVSSPSATVAVGGQLSTTGALTLQSNLSTGGRLAVTGAGLMTRSTSVSTTETRTVAGSRFFVDSAFALSTNLQFTPSGTGVSFQTGGSATRLVTDSLSTTALTTGWLTVQSAISSQGASAVEFSSAQITNSNGSLAISSVTAGSFTVGTFQGVGGAPILPQITTLQTTASSVQFYKTAAQSTSMPFGFTSTLAADEISTSTLNTGTIGLVGDSLTVSTLVISSGILAPALSSLVLGSGGTLTVGTLSSETASVSSLQAPSLQTETVQTATGGPLTLSAPLVAFSVATMSSLVAETPQFSTLRAARIDLGTPLAYSTINPSAPYMTVSTVGGFSSNTLYEYATGIGTPYEPVQIQATNDTTTRLYLRELSTVSTVYVTAQLTYRNDGSVAGSAGLRLVNSLLTSTLLTLNAATISTISSVSLVNYPIETAPFSGSNTFYLVGPSTLELASTFQARLPLVAGGSSGSVRLLYNADGIFVNWSSIGTATSPFSTVNRVAWNGSIWVAGGTGTNTLAYSYDGQRWNGLGSTLMQAVYGLAWNGIRWVAAGAGLSTLATSYDGVNWVGLHSTIFTTAGRAVAWNGTMFVAGGQGSNTLATSYDGVTWTGLGSTVFTSSVQDVAWGSNRFVAAGAGGTTLATSADGITWSTLGVSLGGVGETVAWNGSNQWLVGGGAGTVARSADGLTWSTTSVSSLMSTVYTAAWNSNAWQIGGQKAPFAFATSTDGGATWTGANPPATSTLSTVRTLAPRDRLPLGLSTTDLAIVGGAGGTNQLAYTRNQGASWTGVAIPGISTITDLATNGRIWVATARTGDEIAYQPPQPFSWDYVNSVNATLTSTSAIRSSIGGNSWAISADVVSTPTFLQFRLGTASNTRVIGGFQVTSTTTNTADLRYAFYVSHTQQPQTQINGAISTIGTSNATTSTIFQILYLSTAIIFKMDGSTVQTAAPSSFSAFRMGMFLQDTAASASNILFSQFSYTSNAILTSESGASWSNPTNTVFGYATAVANSGRLWVATGQPAIGNSLAWSADGSNWRGLGADVFTVAGRGITFGSNRWVATGEGDNTLAVSADGFTWTGLGSTVTTRGGGVATNGAVWVTTGAPPNTLAWSPDGSNWTGLSTTVFTAAGTDVAWNGSLWVAVGSGGNTIATSPDGSNWTGQGSAIPATAVAATPSKWILTADGSPSVYTSPDGSNWTAALSTLLSTGTAVAAARPAGTFESLVLAGGRATSNTLAVSADGGSSWTGLGTPFQTLQTTSAIAYSGSRWVAGGTLAGSPPATTLYWSDDAVNWSAGNALANITAVYGVAYGKDKWVAVGTGTAASYQVATSTDGKTWSQLSNAVFTNQTNAVAFGNNLWVAAGTTGGEGLRWSADGLTWNAISLTAGSPTGFFTGSAVAFNGSLWVAGGDFAQIGWSADGSNWTFKSQVTNIISTAQVTGLAFGNGVWVATAVLGGGPGTNSLLVSPDGSNWTGLGSTIFTSRGTGVTFNGSRFVASGYGTNTLAWSADGSNWTGVGEAPFDTGSKQGLVIAARSVLPYRNPPAALSTVQTYNRTFTWNLLNVAVTAQTTVTKTDTIGWSARASSEEGYVNSAYMTFQAGQTNAAIMAGFAETPLASASYANLNFAIYVRSDATVEIYELGVLVGSYGSYTTADVFKITYDGARVKYYKNATLLRTVTRSPGAALYLSSSFYTPGGQLTNIVYHPLYALTTTQPALGTTGFAYTTTAGTAVSQFEPFYLTLSTNLAATDLSINVTLDGSVSTLGTTFYADVYYNETKVTSTTAVQPQYLTPSTYQLNAALTSSFTYTAGDSLSVRFQATRGVGTTYLYTNYESNAVQRSSVITSATPNPNAADYLEFFHTSLSTGQQTSQLAAWVAPSTAAQPSYLDETRGAVMNRAVLQWPSSLNAVVIENRFNDIAFRSLTYTGSLFNASDPDVKTDITRADGDLYLDALRDIPLHRFSYRTPVQEGLHLRDRTQLGLITTDLTAHPVLSTLVTEGPAPDLEGLPRRIQLIDRGQLRAAHLAATQALLQRISSLEARIGMRFRPA